MAVVSDAGMPCISDPGFTLVRALQEADLPWTVIPGPSSTLAALVLSGFSTDRFLYLGYAPRKKGQRRTFLAEALEEPGTVLILESCHRIRSTLEILAELAPGAGLAIAREITKLHEETLRGTCRRAAGTHDRAAPEGGAGPGSAGNRRPRETGFRDDRRQMMDFTEFKLQARGRVRPVVLALDALGMTPLAVSITGLVITALSGWIIAQGNLFLGGLIFLLGSAFDMLDGDLARLQGTVSRRGAFLDSCFDRLGEAFLFAGLTWYFATLRSGAEPVALLLITCVVVGSLTTSYVRARAEGVGETCRVGWLQRTERVILLAVGAAAGPLGAGAGAVVPGGRHPGHDGAAYRPRGRQAARTGAADRRAG